MFGKPVTIIAGAEEPLPIKINISAIPKFRAFENMNQLENLMIGDCGPEYRRPDLNIAT